MMGRVVKGMGKRWGGGQFERDQRWDIGSLSEQGRNPDGGPIRQCGKSGQRINCNKVKFAYKNYPDGGVVEQRYNHIGYVKSTQSTRKI